MLVDRSQLVQYDIAEDLYFSRRTGEGEPVSRDQFFVLNTARLKPGLFCAIGNDANGWELEQFNGVNWHTVEPDPNYSLIITNAGLAALTNVTRGGIQLYFSGIKIINHVVTNPATPIINWTDNELLQAGEVVFSVGTMGSPNQTDEAGRSLLSQILKWRFNTASGGLQYIVTLPPEGFGAIADDRKEQWNIGAIGLYVKDPSNNSTDVLFGVATLPNVVTKYATNVDRVGNAIKLYFNTILSNLGVVSNLQVMSEGEQNLPEVPNETLLTYPSDAKQRPYNCYVIDNMYGSGIPALAVQRTAVSTDLSDPDWAYFMPSDNFILVEANQFADNVQNYMFVYWDSSANIYRPAEGRKVGDAPYSNEKMPVGIRVGNSIVYSGEIVNKSASYQYSLDLASGGADYTVADQLLILGNDGITFKIEVQSIDANGTIQNFRFIGPSVGNIKIEGAPIIMPTQYDPRSNLPRNGSGARFIVNCVEQPATPWNFPANWLKKPLYCDQGVNAGKPTLTKTDSFLGWCTAANSIRLALDLRNESSTTVYGTTRYATNAEVKEVLTNSNASEQTAVTPKTLNDNYVQKTLPTNQNQPGSRLGNPINIESYVRFDKVVLGRGTKTPYDNTTINPDITDAGVSFYGTAYRAYWADIAEIYTGDRIYEPGTLIAFGQGEHEFSAATYEAHGVVSTKPGYILGEHKNELDQLIALTGRVPVIFDGLCLPTKGQKFYLSKYKKGCASTVENGKPLGIIIDKHPNSSRKIECVVRIEF